MAADLKTLLGNLKGAFAQIPKSKIPPADQANLKKDVDQSIKDLEDTVKKIDKLKTDVAAWKNKRKELEKDLSTLKSGLSTKQGHYKAALTDVNDLRKGAGTDPLVGTLFNYMSPVYNNALDVPEELNLDTK